MVPNERVKSLNGNVNEQQHAQNIKHSINSEDLLVIIKCPLHT